MLPFLLYIKTVETYKQEYVRMWYDIADTPTYSTPKNQRTGIFSGLSNHIEHLTSQTFATFRTLIISSVILRRIFSACYFNTVYWYVF